MTDKPVRKNPYVGPRALQVGEKIYGRSSEIYNLLDSLIANRIVLLHSPSGAGKSSIVNAGLIPLLKEEGFTVLGPLRVNLEPPPGLPADVNCNRFTLSVLLELEEHLPAEEHSKIEDLVCITIQQYLDVYRQKHPEAVSLALIFDQFEEILTIAPTAKEEKIAFFSQVGSMLQNTSTWALFAAREDYIAALDPYLAYIPTRLHNTSRLDFLGVNAAGQAIRGPLEDEATNIRYNDQAVAKLVNDLRSVKVQLPDGSTEIQPGPYIEPVQLQVVCRHLINQLSEDTEEITPDDVSGVGDVDDSLAQYYQEQVELVARQLEIPERRIRNWFGSQLITKQGIRGLVQMGQQTSGDLENEAIFMLVSSHLVRAEKRLNSTWYELAHDRLITPVLENNAAWIAKNLNLLQRQTEVWISQGSPNSLLLRGEELSRWNQWALDNPEDVLESETLFLQQSLEQQAIRKERIEREQREQQLKIENAQLLAEAEKRRAEEQALSARNLRRRSVFLFFAFLLSIILGIVAIYSWQDASVQERLARQNANAAETARVEAENERLVSDTLRKTAVFAQQLAQEQADVAKEQASIAYAEKNKAEEEQQKALAAQAEAEEQRAIALAAQQEAEKHLQARSQGLAKAAESIMNSQYELSLLLTVEALDIADTLQARDVLIDGLQFRLARGYRMVDLIQADFSDSPLAFSQDGRYLVWGNPSGHVYVYDTSSKERIPFDNVHSVNVSSVAACSTADDLLVASGSGNFALKLWSLRSATPNLIDDLTSSISALSFNADCTQLAAAYGTLVAFYHVTGDGSRAERTITPLARLENHPISAIAWSPDGTRLATGNAGGQVHLYDLVTGEKQMLKSYRHGITRVAWHPDTGSERLFVAQMMGALDLWNIRLNERENPFPIQTQSQAGVIAISPDGNLAAATGKSNTVDIYSTQTGIRVAELEFGASGLAPNELAFGAPGGRLLLASQTYRTMQIAEIYVEQQLSQPIVDQKPASAMGVDTQGALVAANASEGKIELFDAVSGKVIFSQQQPLDGLADLIAILPGAQEMIVVNATGSIDLIRVAPEAAGNPQPLIPITAQQRAVTALAVRPPGLPADGNSPIAELAMAICAQNPAQQTRLPSCEQVEIQIFHSVSDPPGRLFSYGPAPVPTALALDASGRYLAAGNPLRIWDLTSKLDEPLLIDKFQVKGVPTDQVQVQALAFDPSGEYLAVATTTRELYWLEMESLEWQTSQPARARLYGPLKGFTDQVKSLLYSPAGEYLYVLEANNRITRWLVNLNDWMKLACQAAGRDMTEREWEEYFPGQEQTQVCPLEG